MSRSKWDCLTSLFLAFFIWMNIKKLMFNQYIDLPHVKKKTKDYYINEKRNKRSESFQCVWKNYSFVALRLDVKTQEKKSKDLLSNVTHRSFSLMSNQYERSRANQLFLFIELTLAMSSSSSSFFYSTSSFFDMPHVTSSFTNQSSSEFWLDVTRLSPADGNVIAVFFLLLHPFFGLSAGSFYHDFNKKKSEEM